MVCTKLSCLVQGAPMCLDNAPEPEFCPFGCSVWHDGCNDCKCPTRAGETALCTRRVCIVHGQPRCLDSDPAVFPSLPRDSSYLDPRYNCDQSDNAASNMNGGIYTITVTLVDEPLEATSPDADLQDPNYGRISEECTEFADPGPCRGYFPRYFFNVETSQYVHPPPSPYSPLVFSYLLA
jgi:hypothetical protein